MNPKRLKVLVVWNRSLAAKKLGIGRRTLYDKLARLGISLHPDG